MALPISSLDGVVTAPGAGYPYGDIVDSAVGTAGTRVNRKFTDDLMQTSQKLMADAGITPSGNPDNSINGYQIFEAIINCRPFSSTGIVFTSSGQNLWADAGGGSYNVGFRQAGNMVNLCGAATNSGIAGSATVNILTLPVGARPASSVTLAVLTDTGAMHSISISTAGQVTSSDTTTTFGGTVYLDNVSFRLV